ncbi:MAG: hypothetical protein FJ290_06150 [Planctomycetes bacterium]|nr:hypothetical protein [Planctomycetota bacterium]
MPHRLPFAAHVLVAYALVLAAGHALDAASGICYDPYGFSHGLMSAGVRAVHGALAALGILGAVGVMARTKLGRRLLLAAWIAHAVGDFPNRVLWVLTSPYGDAMSWFWWMSVTHVVLYHGLFIAIAVAYLCSDAVTQATGERGPGPAIPDGLGLPWAARLAGVLAIGCGVHSVLCCLLRAPSGSLQGLRLSQLPFSWAGRWAVSWFGFHNAWALFGGLGVLGGGALLCRLGWGRRLFVAFAVFQAALLIADWPVACSMGLSIGVSAFREQWDIMLGVAAIALHAAFLSSYVCSRRVRDAMRTRVRMDRHDSRPETA